MTYYLWITLCQITPNFIEENSTYYFSMGFRDTEVTYLHGYGTGTVKGFAQSGSCDCHPFKSQLSEDSIPKF